MEKRVLLAAVLSGVVIVLWFTLVAPTPKSPSEAAPTRAAAVTPTAGVAATPTPASQESPAPPRAEVRGADEADVVLKAQGLRVVINPRGGVLRSLVLEDYTDDKGQPLDLVQGARVAPLTLTAQGPWNSELFSVEPKGSGVELSWSDGAGAFVSKTIAVEQAGRYAVNVSVETGGAARGGVVIGSGIGPAAPAGGSSQLATGGIVSRVNGDLERLQPRKVEATTTLRGVVDFAGVEDQYFLLAFLPEAPQGVVHFEKLADNQAQVVVEGPGPVVGLLYAGPKDHTVLAGYGRGLPETISFGIFGFLSVAFLAALKWIHAGVGNWGVAIIVLTAAIRVLLFPLNHKTTVSMRKMQLLQPRMKAIQDRYQERAKKDPQSRARMNQEIMQLYKAEGVNPMGGCLPMLVQLPILFALYTLFAYAIELRHAPFLLWITDLAVPDTLLEIPLGSWKLPVRPLALLMGGSMFWQQKLTPQVGDPAQRQIFMLMPIIFTFMFYGFASGLTLYWLVNNLFTIAQQVLTEKLMARSAAKA